MSKCLKSVTYQVTPKTLLLLWGTVYVRCLPSLAILFLSSWCVGETFFLVNLRLTDSQGPPGILLSLPNPAMGLQTQLVALPPVGNGETQVFMHVWQALQQWSHLPSP